MAWDRHESQALKGESPAARDTVFRPEQRHFPVFRQVEAFDLSGDVLLVEGLGEVQRRIVAGGVSVPGLVPPIVAKEEKSVRAVGFVLDGLFQGRVPLQRSCPGVEHDPVQNLERRSHPGSHHEQPVLAEASPYVLEAFLHEGIDPLRPVLDHEYLEGLTVSGGSHHLFVFLREPAPRVRLPCRDLFHTFCRQVIGFNGNRLREYVEMAEHLVPVDRLVEINAEDDGGIGGPAVPYPTN